VKFLDSESQTNGVRDGKRKRLHEAGLCEPDCGNKKTETRRGNSLQSDATRRFARCSRILLALSVAVRIVDQ
jgi:hypothetical protein